LVLNKFSLILRAIINHGKVIKRSDMYLTAEKKSEFFTTYGKSEKDTGSSEAQIALFSYRINHLTEHLKSNKKDFGTQRALIKLVGKRRRLLDYIKNNDIERYREIVKSLNLRR
jgi:small subunit ribosomal protein S15